MANAFGRFFHALADLPGASFYLPGCRIDFGAVCRQGAMPRQRQER
jgi:hypothetical protein